MPAGEIGLLQTKNKEISKNNTALTRLSSILQYEDTNTNADVFLFFSLQSTFFQCE